LKRNHRVRDVFYSDALENSTNDIIIQVVKLSERKSLLWKYLVIIDNVHTNPDIGKRIFENRRKLDAGHLFVILLARQKFTDREREKREILESITSNSKDDHVPVVFIEESYFSIVLDGIVNNYFTGIKVDICPESEQYTLDRIASKSKHSLWLLSFILLALQNSSHCVDGQTIESIDLAGEVDSYYNQLLDSILIDPHFSDELLQRFTNTQKKKFYNELLSLLSVFSSLEIPLPLPFIHHYFEINSNQFLGKLISGILQSLIDNGNLLKYEDSSYLRISHITVSKILRDIYYNNNLLPNFGQIVDPRYQNSPYNNEMAILSLLKFLKDANETLMLNQIQSICRNLSVYTDYPAEIETRVGFYRFEIDQDILTSSSDDWFSLGESYLFLHDESKAEEALKVAILRDSSYIHKLGIIAEDGALQDYDSEVCPIAQKLYCKLQPWFDEVTDTSLTIHEFYEFDWFEFKGPCPTCDRELYGEIKIPRPNQSSDTIHGSTRYDGYTVDCECGESYDFDIFVDIVHIFFTFDGNAAPSKWNFKYRLHC